MNMAISACLCKSLGCNNGVKSENCKFLFVVAVFFNYGLNMINNRLLFALKSLFIPPQLDDLGYFVPNLVCCNIRVLCTKSCQPNSWPHNQSDNMKLYTHKNSFLQMTFLFFTKLQPSALSSSSSTNGNSSLTSKSLPLTSLKESSQMTQVMVVMILVIVLGIAGLVTIMYLRIVQQRRMSKVSTLRLRMTNK